MRDEPDYGTHDGNEIQGDRPQRGGNDTPALTKIVERVRKLNAEIKEARFEIKELADSAWEKCGYSAKAVKALAKESAWNEVEREARRQLEEEIDKGRVALGFLADTPLGQAEMERMEAERQASIIGDGKKKRGRPAKPKATPAEVYPSG
jgi:hypothetical protein